MKSTKPKTHEKRELRTESFELTPKKISVELFPDGEKSVEWDHEISLLDSAKTDSDKWFKRFFLILRILNRQDESAEHSKKMYLALKEKKDKRRILSSDTENIIPHAIQIEIIGKRLYKDEPNKKNPEGKISPMWINPILIDMFEYELIHTWKIIGSKSGGMLYKISDKGKDALKLIEAGDLENFHKKYPTEDDHPLRVLYEKLQS